MAKHWLPYFFVFLYLIRFKEMNLNINVKPYLCALIFCNCGTVVSLLCKISMSLTLNDILKGQKVTWMARGAKTLRMDSDSPLI